MAQTPDIYFNDLWTDAQMGDVLAYVLNKSERWSPEAVQCISQVPWQRVAVDSTFHFDSCSA